MPQTDMADVLPFETAPPAGWSPPVPTHGGREPTPRLFGHFLVRQGLLDASALDEALALMAATNATVGELAVARGLMTAAEAEEVNRLQRYVDQRFGDLAVSHKVGGMTPQQLDALCWEQETTNIRLSDALVELGHVSSTEVEGALREFEYAEAEHPNPLETLPAVLRQSVGARLALESIPRLAQRVLRMPARMGQARPWQGQHYEAHATVGIGGAHPCALGLTADAAAVSVFVGRIDAAAGRFSLAPNCAKLEPSAAIAQFAGLVAALVQQRLAHLEPGARLPETLSVAGELPTRGWGFDIAFGHGRALLIIDAS